MAYKVMREDEIIGTVAALLFTIIAVIIVILMTAFFSPREVKAQEIEYGNEQIINAIFLAEGGVTAEYPYGIRSLKYENRTDRSLSRHDWARWICKNTVKNHRKRHLKHDCGTDYISCLGRRYCPTRGNLSKAERKLNIYWLKNVRHFLNNVSTNGVLR